MSPVLVTGATGFVGNVLCESLARSGRVVRAALRSARPVQQAIAQTAVVGDIGAATSWADALRGVDSVVHLAARAHVMNDGVAQAHSYFETNERGTRCLAEAAGHAGVRRFVLLSSVKVNGEASNDRAYRWDDPPQPQDDYGTSKYFAEQRLREVAAETGMEAVIVRSPLVYGPGVRANFLRMLQWVDRQWPLPLGAIRNRRSLVSIWNLCDLLLRSLQHPDAAGGTFLVSDGCDVSTPDLVRAMASAMGRKARLLPVPVAVLRAVGRLTGRRPEVERLCGSLAVDISATRRLLHWSPPTTLTAGLERTVDWYLAQRGRAGV